ncbi:putative odorant receptor 71a [Sitodiplosis mosellana]|uniref:putative odorant receptor 71a n=1 Tax=Sitodiplosis mosellana TaxID=263140 RepID=UPI002443BBB6|nr:putative odorant receptor 71a [Sitodiplosis mosellana]
MAVMSWIQFYFICETGQDIEDNGLDDILYDSNWVDLPCELQKDLMQLISQRQNRVTLDVGPFGVVNRDLFAKVTNKVYSFVMFLRNFAS